MIVFPSSQQVQEFAGGKLARIIFSRQLSTRFGNHDDTMNESSIRILLVEDDPALARELLGHLERENWSVDHVTCLADAFEAIITKDYRAILLDRKLPDGDGTSLIAAANTRPSKPPIILITARDEVADRIDGLNLGADDYLVKPFAFGELMARLKAVSRRSSSEGPSSPKTKLGQLEFDPSNREASVGSARLDLPRRELALLEILVRRAGRVVLREHIDSELYGFDGDVSATAIETHISRLRRRLKDAEAGVELRTIRGVGYLLQSC